MIDRPIIFSAPMVRALLDGRKTQTRRLAWKDCRPNERGGVREQLPSPWQRVKVGDRLWVRESFALELQETGGAPVEPVNVMYAADGKSWDGPTVPSIHMPRWASRLTLVVTATRIERLRHITEDDAKAEGFAADDNAGAWHRFLDFWNELHGDNATDNNPEVVVLTFDVHKGNIDKVAP